MTGAICCVVGGTVLAGLLLWRRGASTLPQVEILVGAAGQQPLVTYVSQSDDVTIRVRAASAMWIYRGDTLVAACPGPGCIARNDGFELTLRLAALGRHRVVAIACSRAFTSTGNLDADVLGARALGASLDLAVIDVFAPR